MNVDWKPILGPTLWKLFHPGETKPRMASGGIIHPIGSTIFGIDFDATETIVPLNPHPPDRTIADQILAERFYVRAHPATPDTFYAGMLHAANIAKRTP